MSEFYLSGKAVMIYYFIMGCVLLTNFIGIVAGFSAAWWAGLLCIIPPLGLINGFVYIVWGGTNLAANAVAWIVASAVGVPWPLC